MIRSPLSVVIGLTASAFCREACKVGRVGSLFTQADSPYCSLRTLMPDKRESFGLPPRVFLYTVDQIALMIGATEKQIKNAYLHYEGREIVPRPHNKMLARNLNEPGEKPEWRVAEPEFIRWLRYKGFRVYNRTRLSS